MNFSRSLIMILVAALSIEGGLRADENARMRIETDEATIRMYRGDKIILQYNKMPTAEAAKHEPHFSRSGYIHPVYSPAGHAVTGDFAEDHKHQHGLFFAWTKTKFEKRKPEFWNQKLEAGSVSFVRQHPETQIDPAGKSCSFIVEHLWEDKTAENGPKPVLSETWKVTAFDAGSDRFVFDIESTQNVIGEKPLTIEKYHYGGMAIRGPDSWFDEDKEATPPGGMITSAQLDRIEGNHSRPEWVAMFGPIKDGESAGVAVIPAQTNFRHPQWVRLHPNKPYFVFAPMVEEPFRIEPGQPYVSKFRYVVYDGEPDVELIQSEQEKMGE